MQPDTRVVPAWLVHESPAEIRKFALQKASDNERVQDYHDSLKKQAQYYQNVQD